MTAAVATSSTGDSYSLAGTIGQPDAGPAMTGGAYSLMGGFLAGISAGSTAPVSISGNAGVGGATLSYDDGGPQSVMADGLGDYVISVPYLWTGSVTPSKGDYTFTPDHRDYAVLTEDQINQDYSASAHEPTITRLYPADESTACLRPAIGVDLLLADLVRTAGGAFNKNTVMLKLDSGSNLINQARIRVTLSDPATHATILYVPGVDLDPVSHQVEFTYPGVSGPLTQTWSFTAADIACGS